MELGLYLFELQVALGPFLRCFILKASSSRVIHFLTDLFVMVPCVILLGNEFFGLVYKLPDSLLLDLIHL